MPLDDKLGYSPLVCKEELVHPNPSVMADFCVYAIGAFDLILCCVMWVLLVISDDARLAGLYSWCFEILRDFLLLNDFYWLISSPVLDGFVFWFSVMQAADIKVLASLGRDELRKICGENFPEWISFPVFEQVFLLVICIFLGAGLNFSHSALYCSFISVHLPHGVEIWIYP